MPRFKIGVEIEQTRWTVVVVETEASGKQEAERKAVGHVARICTKPDAKKELGIDRFTEWDEDGELSCAGINHDENWDSEDYEPNLKV
jgi:hypothetical protein